MSGYPISEAQHQETVNLSFTSRPDSARMKIIEEEEAAQQEADQQEPPKKPQPSDIIE